MAECNGELMETAIGELALLCTAIKVAGRLHCRRQPAGV
jgi:hypothetical protein